MEEMGAVRIASGKECCRSKRVDADPALRCRAATESSAGAAKMGVGSFC